MNRDETILSLHRRGVGVVRIAELWDLSDDEVVAIINAERAKAESRVVAAYVGPKHPEWVGEED